MEEKCWKIPPDECGVLVYCRKCTEILVTVEKNRKGTPKDGKSLPKGKNGKDRRKPRYQNWPGNELERNVRCLLENVALEKKRTSGCALTVVSTNPFSFFYLQRRTARLLSPEEVV